MSLWPKPEALRRASSRTDHHRKLFSEVPVGMALLESGTIAEANRAFAELVGSAAEALTGQTLSQLFGLTSILESLPARGSVSLEASAVNGRPRLLALTITALEGEAAHVVSARDVTIERGAQHELDAQRAFLRKVIDTVPGFVFVKDCDSRFLLANAALARAYGATVEEITGKCDADFNADHDEIEHFRADDREVIASRKPKLILAEKVTYASGDVRWVTTVKVPIVDGDGNCNSLLAVCTDITDLKAAEAAQTQLQERMLEAQKLESLGVLAGGIAHDFNNLLLAILGSAEGALLELPQGSKTLAGVMRIRTAAVRAAELTNQLLAYSGRGHFVVETLDLNALVSDMAELLNVATERRAELSFDFAGDLPGVTADVTQLRQVVMNLITNAVDALGECGGQVRLATGAVLVTEGEVSGRDGALPGGQYVFVRVEDSGAGMDESVLGKIFEPFFTTKFAGRGLGLAAVLGIVRGHRGAIDVKTRPGFGSTFTVLLPASAQTPRQPSRRAPQLANPPGGGSHSVLVIDDEELICFTTRQLLELSGFRALTATSGAEALLLFERDPADAVLLDLTMPTMPADEVLAALRARSPAVKIVLMSGYDEQEIQSRLGSAEIAAFLPKPFTLEQLNDTLKDVLGERSAENR
jgi:two-component system, cell cycle sensor histidine kinase and response regulator CckA